MFAFLFIGCHIFQFCFILSCHSIFTVWIFEQPQMTQVNGSTETDRSCLVGLRDGYELSSATLLNTVQHTVPKTHCALHSVQHTAQNTVQHTVQDTVQHTVLKTPCKTLCRGASQCRVRGYKRVSPARATHSAQNTLPRNLVEASVKWKRVSPARANVLVNS